MHYILDFTWESSGKSGWFALFVIEAFEAQYLSVFKAQYFDYSWHASTNLSCRLFVLFVRDNWQVKNFCSSFLLFTFGHPLPELFFFWSPILTPLPPPFSLKFQSLVFIVNRIHRIPSLKKLKNILNSIYDLRNFLQKINSSKY